LVALIQGIGNMKPDQTRPKIALFGNFGTGNLGNEATLQAMVYNLRRYLPTAEISCVCPAPENAASEHHISAVPIRASLPGSRRSRGLKTDDGLSGGSNGSYLGSAIERHRRFQISMPLGPLLQICARPFLETYRWFKGVAELRGSDLLIMTGTGMVGDFAISPFGLHYDIFRWAVIAKLCRCKLLFISIGGGPVSHPVSRAFIKMALLLADYRSYRDLSSKEHLEAIGVNVTNDAVYPDLAFSLPDATAPAAYDPAPGRGVIGVGVMNYYGRSGNDNTIYCDYIARLAAFVIGLLKLKYTVRVLIGDAVWDQGARQDLRAALAQRGLRYKDCGIIDEPASSVDQLFSQLSMVDVVVSCRFHNLVLALILGKPVLAISYHDKFQPLMDSVGLGEFCQDIEHLDANALIEKVIVLKEDALSIRQRIACDVTSFRDALDEQYHRLPTILLQHRLQNRSSLTTGDARV
jgi:polysaccharide pyruvyl transferase WcaK-like protein